MSADKLADASRLTDQELVAQVRLLAMRERRATAVLIAHLAVFDERRLYLAEGYSRLFVYCTKALHFSESGAYRRTEAARLARRYPVILDMLSDGSANLTNVLLLGPELTPANHRTLLASARHRTKEQVQELIASLRPKPTVASSMRKLPSAPTDSTPRPTSESLTSGEAISASAPAAPPTARAIVAPLAPQRYKVIFTANGETYEKLRQLRDLLRHQIPSGDLGQIIDRALTLLLREVTQKKIGAAERSAKNGDINGRSRHIPAGVRREVWIRDGGQCAFVSSDGQRCADRAFLEFHHVKPFSAGGQATIDNIELRCRSHNGYESEVHFGARHRESESETVRKLGL